MRHIIIAAGLFLTLLGAPQQAAAETVTLEETLRKSRERAVEMLRLKAELKDARANLKRGDAPHDVFLFGNAMWREDRTESASAFAGERRNSLSTEFGTRKVFPRATALEATLSQTREFTKFPPPQPGAPAASAFQSFNPSYRVVAEITARQPLWRNWLGREFELQRELLRSNVAPAELNLLLQEQMVQAETEQYYWNLAEMEARQRLIQELIELNRKFAALMRERTRYGRADQVDVADAESSVVAQEGALLDLRITAQHLRRRLRIAMDPTADFPADVTGPVPIYLPEDILAQGGPSHAADSADRAYEYALEHRVDLKLLRERRKPLQLQLALTKEENKPSINLFGGAGKAGLEGRWDQTVVDTVDDGKDVFYNIGIEAEVNLQRSDLRAQKESIAAKLEVLDARAEAIRANIRQEIEFAYAGFEAARRKQLQAQRAINTLETKRRAELEKFRQARSEEIVVLSYLIEVLAARSELISAHKLARDADVRLRTALHAYPSSYRDHE